VPSAPPPDSTTCSSRSCARPSRSSSCLRPDLHRRQLTHRDRTRCSPALGIGGLAFAFAAKDTIENFFGSITVIADRPFQVGDWVVIGDTEGTVEELGFRSTRVRTFYNSLITLPNATLVRATVDNYGRRKYRRVKTHIGISTTRRRTPSRPSAKASASSSASIPTPARTTTRSGSTSSERFESRHPVYVFHETPDWQTELRERHRLWLDIIRLADRLGVQFAFPTQTLHLHQHEGDAERLPAEPPSSTDERKSLLIGRRAVRDITREQPWQDEKPGPYVFHGPSREDDEDDTQIESKVGGDA
jgi:MscS family membrane protein